MFNFWRKFDLDDDFTAYGLPLASLGRVRRLDYGLAGARVYASQLDHAPGPADHLTVRYGFDFNHVGGHSGPRRKLLSMSKVVEQSAFDSLWSQEAFDHALTTGQFDGAWKLLSIAAETLLGETPAENSVPRSDSWIPQEVLPHAGRVRGDQVESFPLRQLRRLHRRLLQLRRDPFDARLRHAAGRSIGSLIHVFSAVSEICLFDLEAAVECVDSLVCSTAQTETSARIEQWKHRLVADPGKQLGWIQRKADAEFVFRESDASPPSTVPSAAHTSIIASAECEWMSVCTKPSFPDGGDSAAVQRVLDNLYPPSSRPVQMYLLGCPKVACYCKEHVRQGSWS